MKFTSNQIAKILSSVFGSDKSKHMFLIRDLLLTTLPIKKTTYNARNSVQFPNSGGIVPKKLLLWRALQYITNKAKHQQQQHAFFQRECVSTNMKNKNLNTTTYRNCKCSSFPISGDIGPMSL